MSSKTIYQHITGDRTPYVYLIGWTKHDEWYYGVRYGRNCHPDDLWKTYFTSSNCVVQFRKEHGEPDVIEIRKVFSNAVTAKNHEDSVLRRMKVNLNEKWLNVKADSFKNLDTSKIAYLYGDDNPMRNMTEEQKLIHRKLTSEGTIRAIANSEKYQEQQKWWMEYLKSDKNPGKNKTQETKDKISASKIGKPNPKIQGENNPMYGRNIFLENTEEWCENQKDIRRQARLNEKYKCPHCERIIGTTANFTMHLIKIHKIEKEIIKIQYKDCRLPKP